MQLTQKHIISLAVVAIIAMLGYSAVQNNTPSQSDGVKLSTGSISSVSQSGTGVEIDTSKRLETVTNSGTAWGMSPFGSGKPLEEAEKKPVFQKPNTEWKSRYITLSDGRTLYYEYGKGNPAEVAMNPEQIDAMTKTCENNVSLAEKGVCNIESGTMFYMTSEVEKYLLIALSDPNWSKLSTECENNFRFIEDSSDAFTNAQNDPEYPLFDRVFSPGWLDMDRYISIDPNTGLKLLNRIRVNNIAGFLIDASHYGRRKDDGWINPRGDCVDRYGTEIARNLKATIDLYQNPLTYVNGYTNQFILSKQFNLSQF